VVRTKLARFGAPHDGVELAIEGLGVVRIRALAQRPGTPVPMQTAYQGQAGRSRKLLKQLLKRGARYEPRG